MLSFMTRAILIGAIVVAVTGTGLGSVPAAAQSGITYTDIAAGDGAGITYRRTRSPRDENYHIFMDGTLEQPLQLMDIALFPVKSRGAPGVCIFDFDNDGDEDIYVTNGPGSAASLYSSQWAETGDLAFVDVATQAGVALVAEDGSGCAYGDIDNDGDQDLYVLGSGEPNHLYENQGNATFVDITAQSATGGGNLYSTTASMGDVNNDGLLDIAVGNTFDWAEGLPVFAVPTALNEHNQLFVNQGGNVFVDVSAASGIEDLGRMRIENPDGSVMPIPDHPAGISWTLALVDYDLDGDVDLFTGDDQAAIPPVGFPPSPFGAPNADRGLVHVFRNDGTGNFEDVNDRIISPNLTGSWMGLAFGDFNHDGVMDFFNSNFGDSNISISFEVPTLGYQPSRWFLGDGNGGFVDSLSAVGGPIPGIVSTPFGWGSVAVDYDNDGCTDILFVGDIQGGPFITLSNPLAILRNDCAGNFQRDQDAVPPQSAERHKLSAEHGMAAADLNQDGFLDLVSVSNFRVPAELRQPQAPLNAPLIVPNPFDLGGPFDADTEFSPVFAPHEDGHVDFIPALLGFPDGALSIEVSGGNDNHWVRVDLLGTVGLVPRGRVNRDAIGAVVSFTPQGGVPAMQAVSGGAGYSSQGSLVANFGLGQAEVGTVDVLWPGGTRNRLYNVRHSQTVFFPEIPCSFDTRDPLQVYFQCVNDSMQDLIAAGILDPWTGARFRASAVRAYREERRR